MTLLEKLRLIDKKCFEEGYDFYDLQGLYESTKLTAQDKQEIDNIVKSVDDTEKVAAMIGAYIQTKEQQNEGLMFEADDECEICEECGKKLKLDPRTGDYYCPTCEQYLVEDGMDTDAYIDDDFYYELNGKAYTAHWAEDVIRGRDWYDIYEYPDWDSIEDEDAEVIFQVSDNATVGEVIDKIKEFNEE